MSLTLSVYHNPATTHHGSPANSRPPPLPAASSTVPATTAAYRTSHPGSVADAETDSLTAESGFEEQEVTSAGVEVTRFVSRFVDKVCTEGHVTQEHIRCVSEGGREEGEGERERGGKVDRRV